MNIDMKALKGVIEEIEASKVRQKGEAEFQREAIKRAVKQHQLDGKAIRIVLQRRAMGDEKRDEQDYYVHAYEMALGGKKLAADALASGATIREAAVIGGISTGAAGNLAKVVQKSAKLDKPEDGDDGITESCGLCSVSPADGAGKGNGLPSAKGNAEDSPAARRHTSDDALAPALGISQCADDAAPGPHDTLTDDDPRWENLPPAPRSVGAVAEDASIAAMEEAGARLRASLAARAAGNR